MPVNPRKSVCLPNRTNYFNPDKDKAFVRFASDKSYRYRVNKIEGYESRIYWEFRYCQEHSGQSFYYTLTYNDKALPTFEGQNCFDYQDLVYLLNGGFKKYLLRNYGTNFKYFVSAELGDGKGERGLHNNPHYHVIFFLRPDFSYSDYKPITPEEFRHLIRLYWQGFDQDEKRVDFRDAKLGIVKEGKFHLGQISDFRAIKYVAKYVCKDSALKRHERYIVDKFRCVFTSEVPRLPETKIGFLYDVIFPLYNFPDGCYIDKPKKWKYSPDALLKVYLPSAHTAWHMSGDDLVFLSEDCPDLHVAEHFLNMMDLSSEYELYCSKVVELKVAEKLNLFRNRYSNKCRVSHGLGEYALKFIDDKLNPSIKVPDKDGFKPRPISLFYYRKLFTNVVKDALGNPVYVLNDSGKAYKLHQLKKQLHRLYAVTDSNLNSLNEQMYSKMLYSDVNTSVNMSYNSFVELFNSFDKKTLLNRYALYKLVYEGRYFPVSSDGLDSPFRFPRIDCDADYSRFLDTSVGVAPYYPGRVRDFLSSDCEGYLSYNSHPYFLRYSRLFAVFDLLADYLFCENDEQNQLIAEEIARVKRFHKSLELKSFYKSLNL